MNRVGDYEIIRKLGEGGMGSVFLARSKDGVPVVLKTPHQPTPELVARMEDEARTGFRLRHRHIVRTLDFFSHEGRPVLVIEWIDGASLKELRDEHGRLPPSMVARVGEQVSDALATIHHLKDDATGQELRMLHRDVTPGNIVVSRDGDAKLIDLGIARSVESQSQKTAAGILRGTFRYLSPDLFAGAPYSWMTDLWALGVTLFEAALGRRAIEGDNARVFNAVAKGRLTELRVGEELHPMLKMLFDGLLAPDPQKRRFKDPEEVLHAFRVVRGRLGDGEQETRTVMGRVADRAVAATSKKPAAPAPVPAPAPAPASPGPTTSASGPSASSRAPSSSAPSSSAPSSSAPSPSAPSPSAPSPSAPSPSTPSPSASSSSSSAPAASASSSSPPDSEDAEVTVVTRSGPAAPPARRRDDDEPRAAPASFLAESTVAESMSSDLDGQTTEVPRSFARPVGAGAGPGAVAAPLSSSAARPLVAPSSKDAPPTLSMAAWRPLRAPSPSPSPATAQGTVQADDVPTATEPPVAADARKRSPTTTTKVMAAPPGASEPPTLPTLRRPGGDDGGGRGRAKVGGLLADPPAKKAQRKSAVTSPTIRVVVDELIPETGEDPLSARATLVSSVDSASIARGLAARDDNDDDDKGGGGGAP